MRILYGVQATGQGHISRARAMAEALSRYPVDVTWLFSGRDRNDLFDMEPFGQFEWRRGLTFSSRRGRVSYLRTLLDNDIGQFLRDVKGLALGSYDLVVTDFEPVSAWAARIRNVPSIGIGHQYAFGPTTPMLGDWLSRQVMRNFAPVDTGLGLHWHQYGTGVLPPILDLPDHSLEQDDHILVYLPFEDQQWVTELLNKLPDTRFVQYARDLPAGIRGNVIRRPANTVNFKRHLATCSGVICNSGFELISECLQWRKPVLTKPLQRQMEQLSNALALEQLRYARPAHDLSVAAIEAWLASPVAAPELSFPDVAAELAAWLAGGAAEPATHLSDRLWQQTHRHPVPTGPALPSAA